MSAKPKASRPRNMTPVEEAIVKGLEQFRDDLKAGVDVATKFTSRKVAIEEPRDYTPEKVKAVREMLGMSQDVFAKFLGASTQTVSGWEQGRSISPIACRFMDEIRRSPSHFLESFNLMARPKQSDVKDRKSKRTSDKRKAKSR